MTNPRKDWDFVGYVYFMRYLGSIYQAIPTGSVKIGYTANMTQRMANFSHFEPCELLGVMKGTRWDEKRTQKQFRDLRVYGEWFKPDAKLMAFIYLYTQSCEVRGIATNWLCEIPITQLPLFGKEQSA